MKEHINKYIPVNGRFKENLQYGVIRSRKLKMGRQYTEQTKKDQTMIYKKSLKIPKG
jgi:hypothetical protein